MLCGYGPPNSHAASAAGILMVTAPRQQRRNPEAPHFVQEASLHDSRVAGAVVVRSQLAINEPLEGGVALHAELLGQGLLLGGVDLRGGKHNVRAYASNRSSTPMS